jgi:hypothetical protein
MARSRLLRMFAALGAAVVATTALAGCVGRPGGIQAPDSWTIMKFEIADTNLEPFLMVDVEEMGLVGTRPGLNIISLIDRAEGYTDTPVLGLSDWVGAKVVEIGRGVAEVKADLGEVNTGDPEILAGFIRESIRAYPAANYALIISDHGASWPGIGGDESAGGDVLTLDELQQAIREGLAGSGVDRLDLLGLDACLMATFEVASTMAPVADLLLASQELEPGHGWNYTALEAAYRGASPEELGSALIDGFRSQALSEGFENEITLSLIDLTQMPAVDAALRAFATALTERVEGIAPTVGRTLAETLGFGTNPDPRYDVHMKDLAILAAEIGIDALDVADEADALVRAINDAVLDKVDGQATRGATVMSIYFPPEGALYNEQYAAVAAETGWADFLRAYYTAGERIPDDQLPSFITNDATIEFADGGLYISGAFGAAAEANIAEAYIRYGVLNPDGSISLIGDEPAQVSSDGSGTALGFYDLSYLTISDGEDTSSAYLSYSLDSSAGTATIEVPLSYYPPAGSTSPVVADALLSLGLNPSTGTIVSEIYYAYSPQSGTYGELSVEPTGLIQPLVQNLYPDGSTEWVPTSDIGLYADLPNLTYALEALPSGTRLYIELWVVDFGGNSDYVNALVTVP